MEVQHNFYENGFTNKFKLNYSEPRVHAWSNSLMSAYKDHYELVENVNKEIKLGCIVGLFNQLPLANIHLPPAGLVPKSDGGWRMITHLSYPKSSSGFNSFKDPDLCAFPYASFDGVIDVNWDQELF